MSTEKAKLKIDVWSFNEKVKKPKTDSTWVVQHDLTGSSSICLEKSHERTFHRGRGGDLKFFCELLMGQNAKSSS
jgi:hypothetical protein